MMTLGSSDALHPAVVVVDDDPTGSQTVRGIDLLFGVQPDLLAQRLAGGCGQMLFVLTNSRSLGVADAAAINAHVADLIQRHASATIIVSRGDSTLRGHIRAEVDALLSGLAGATDVVRLFCPAFIEAGRVTQDDIHYVRSEGSLTPVGETPFARDATFGYRSSDLREFLAEIGAVERADDVRSLSLTAIREGGSDAVADALGAAAGGWVVGNAMTDEDVETIAAGVHRARRRGVPVLIRSGPSLPRHLAGQPRWPALSPVDLERHFGARRGHGIVAVGSHVPITAAQLGALESLPGLEIIELEANACVAGGSKAADAVGEVVKRASESLADRDVVIVTSREEIRGGADDLGAAEVIADALCATVGGVVRKHPPAWVIAKGGITSHRIACDALSIRSGTVVGQLFDGQVSVLSPHGGVKGVVGMPYVIFPGNVGESDALRVAVERMRVLARWEESAA